MSIPVYVQSNQQTSPNTPGGVASVSQIFGHAVTAGNIGLCVVFNTVGEGPTAVTSPSNPDDSWCPYPFFQTNVGYGDIFVCLNMSAASAGAYRVTATGVMNGDNNGAPVIVIAEFSASPGAYVVSLQPNNDIFAATNSKSGFGSFVKSPTQTIDSLQVMFIYILSTVTVIDGTSSETTVAHDSVFIETNGVTGCMAYGGLGADGQNSIAVMDSGLTNLSVFVVVGVAIMEIT